MGGGICCELRVHLLTVYKGPYVCKNQYLDVVRFFKIIVCLLIFGILCSAYVLEGFLDSSDGKESTCIAGVWSLIPGLGRSPGEGHGNPLQYYCLENPMDREAGPATVLGVTESQTQLRN